MKEIEALFKKVEKKIYATLQNIPAPAEQIYACSFWLFYCDYSSLGTPIFAYNTVGDVDEEEKWSPPEWYMDEDEDMLEALEELYSEINTYMEDKSEEEWSHLIRYQWDFYCKLCLNLNESRNSDEFPLKHWNLSDDFIFAVLEEREGSEIFSELVVKSVGRERAEKLGILNR